MSVRVLPATLRLIRAQETVVLLVRSPEPERLAEALPAAAVEFDRAFSVLVGGPAAVPGGRLLMVDFGDAPQPARRDAVERFATRLAAGGVADAEIAPAPEIGDRYLALDEFPLMARAMLRSPGQAVGVAPTAEVVTVALDWLRGRHRPVDELLGVIISMETPLSWDEVRATVDMVIAGDAGVSVLSTDFATAAVAASFPSSNLTGPTLTAAGAGWDAADAAGHMVAQREHLRRHVESLGWAGVTVRAPRTGEVWLPDNTRYEAAQPHPLWYQVLTAEQIAQLGGPPRGATELAGGRVEITIGDPEQWVPGHRDNRKVEKRARSLLSG